MVCCSTFWHFCRPRSVAECLCTRQQSMQQVEADKSCTMSCLQACPERCPGLGVCQARHFVPAPLQPSSSTRPSTLKLSGDIARQMAQQVSSTNPRVFGAKKCQALTACQPADGVVEARNLQLLNQQALLVSHTRHRH